jgi:hypothetical protein
MSSKKNKDRDVRHVNDNGRAYLIIDGVIQTGQQEVEFYQREAIRSRLEKKLGQKILFPDELEEENAPTIQKEDTINAPWADADEMRDRKKKGGRPKGKGGRPKDPKIAKKRLELNKRYYHLRDREGLIKSHAIKKLVQEFPWKKTTIEKYIK